jgi:DNA ligase (NAD+)
MDVITYEKQLINHFQKELSHKRESYDDLINILKQFDNLYYNSQPSISDDTYDIVRRMLYDANPDNEYFNSVGASPSKKGDDYNLPFVLGSLNKCYGTDIEKWVRKELVHRNPDKQTVIITEKLDGMSVFVEYIDGKISVCSSRGNGTVGKDITDVLVHGKVVPEQLDFEQVKKEAKFPEHILKRICLRGEILLFENRHTECGMKSRRNGVTGIIHRAQAHRDKMENVDKLSAVFYELITPDVPEFNEIHRLQIIQLLGFRVPYTQTCEFSQITEQKMTNMLIKVKSDYEKHHDIDGLVLTPIDFQRENVPYPTHKVAFKYNPDGIECVLTGMEWNVSRFGRLVPVGLLNPPIRIESDSNVANVSRVTLNNAKYVIDKKVGIGAKIELIRSGDVIPHVKKIVEPLDYVELPTVCPECGCTTLLKKDRADMYCTNPSCIGMIRQQVAHFFVTLGVKRASHKTFNRIVNELKITHLQDFFEFDYEKLMMVSGFQRKSAKSLVEQIQLTTQNLTSLTFLRAIGCSGIGEVTSRNILEKFTLEQLFADPRTIITQHIDGVGQITQESLIEALPLFRDLYYYMKQRFGFDKVVYRSVRSFKTTSSTHSSLKSTSSKSTSSKLSDVEKQEHVKEVEKPKHEDMTGKVIVFTGGSNRGHTRKQLATLVSNVDGIVSNTVNSKTSLLVVDDLNTATVKMKKARELKVRVVDYTEFYRMIGY